MSDERVSVWWIYCATGPRNERLYRIWSALEKLWRDRMKLRIFPNSNYFRDHDECLRLIWAVEESEPNRYAILTEHDFLPDMDSFFLEHELSKTHPVMAPKYITRNPETLEMIVHEFPAASYLSVDKQFTPQLNTACGGPFNDPACVLGESLERWGKKVQLMEPEDCYPEHFGVKFRTGTHLFWSRHYHDDPSITITGQNLGKIQEGHDLAVEKWLASQSDEFMRLYNAQGKAG